MATWAKGIDFKNTNNTKRIGGVGVYGTDATTNKLYIGLGAEPWNNAGLQLTSSAINFKGNKIYHAGDKPTASEIGAAASSHTHTTLLSTGLSGQTVSLNNYTLSSGSPQVAYYYCPTDGGGSGITGRPDDNNKHAFYLRVELIRWASSSDYISKQTYIRGNEKIMYVRYCTNGTWTSWEKIYTSNNKPTASEIGAAASSHTHNYMPHTKYTTTQDANNIKTTGVYSFNATCTNAATSNHGTLIAEFNVGTPYQLWIPDNANIIYKRNYTTSSGTWGSWSNTLTNNISGNASTATTLQTARTLTIGNTGKSFNGSGNVSWSLSEIGALDKNNDSTLASGKKILLGYSSSWLNGDSSNGAVTLRAGGNLFIHGDADSSSSSEYVSIKAGNNDLRVISSAASTGQDKLTFNGNIVYHAGRKPTVSEIGAAASNHSHNLVNLGSEAFGSGNDLNTYNTNRTWVCRTGNSSVNRPADYYTVLNVGAEYNSNFQLAHHYGSASEFFVRGRHDTTGSYTPWAKVYTDKNKPTPADIGAAASSHSHSYLPLSGGTLTGTLALKLGGSTLTGAGIATGNTQLIGTATDTIYFGNPKTKIILESNSTPSVSVNGKTYAMYHTGNKPTASEIGAAAESHTHSGYAASSHNHTSLTGITSLRFATESSDSASITTTIDGANTYFDFNLADDPTQNDMWRWRFSPSGGTVFNAMTLDATSTTEAKLTVQGNITASSLTGPLSGNASTATKLQNARTINGTSFDGTGNITTANWGTARTLTIGNTGKSVNGSGNVAWSLSEIGAAASNHSHNVLSTKGTNTIGTTTDDTTAKWGAQGNSIHWYTKSGCLNNQPSQYGYILNLGSGTEVHQLWMTQASGNLAHRGGNGSGWSGTWRTILDSSNFGTYAAAASHSHNYAASNSAGGAALEVIPVQDTANKLYLTGVLDFNSAKIRASTPYMAGGTITATTFAGALSGNATTATTLQNSRTINGTSFNGSANITTANWGTARNIQIGNTSKSVNGSANVSWSLSEIGAAASSHTHNYLPLSGGEITGNLSIKTGSPTLLFFNKTAQDPKQSVMKIMSNYEGSLQIGLHSGSEEPENAFTIRTDGNIYSEGNLITLKDGGVWKSLDLYRTNSKNVEGYARYGIGSNPDGPSPSIEYRRPFSSSSFTSRIDLNKNSIALVVQDGGSTSPDQSAWLGFYSGGNSQIDNRMGYVGRASKGNTNISLVAEKGALQLRTNYEYAATGLILDSDGYFRPETSNGWSCGKSNYRWSTVYYTNLNAASDEHLKENITYIPKDNVATVSTFTKEKDSIITENDLYNFVKNDLSLATYDYKTSLLSNPNEKDKFKNKIGFIAQDIKDTKIGKIFIKADEVEETPDVIGGDVAEREDEVINLPRIISEDVKEIYSYDLTDYVNILAGALKVAMNKIEELENKLENLTDNN